MKATFSIFVGLVSSQPIRLAGLMSVFEDHPSIIILCDELSALLKEPRISCLILDFGMQSNWMEVQLEVRKLRPDVQQVVMGPPGNDELIMRSLTCGARAYLDADTGPFALRRAVECVLDGSIWAPRKLLSELIDRLISRQIAAANVAPPALSPREQQVLDLILAASSNREIAQALGIEERTVKSYVASLLRKTGTDSRVSLSIQAVQNHLRAKNSVVA